VQPLGFDRHERTRLDLARGMVAAVGRALVGFSELGAFGGEDGEIHRTAA
jgi:hypothetical protein